MMACEMRLLFRFFTGIDPGEAGERLAEETILGRKLEPKGRIE